MDELAKILDAQEKAEKNKKHQDNEKPAKKLPSKQHSTNK